MPKNTYKYPDTCYPSPQMMSVTMDTIIFSDRHISLSKQILPIIGILLMLLPGSVFSVNTSEEMPDILPGAWQMESYLHRLEGKRVAIAGNHTSTVGDVHLVDTLLARGVNVVKVFSPEHGFRGEAAAGELVASSQDEQSGLPVISLYGENRRPAPEDLNDVDIVLFDMQDVGTRFYTYISTMTYIMEEISNLHIPLIILDRPNPNGHFTDGPLMEPAYTSFVGLHPVPVVHGLTVGEYARMVSGEGWLGKASGELKLTIIPVQNYHKGKEYILPVPPSPNLPNMRSIYLYPSLCFFEGTDISVGRGTQSPFQVFGHPDLPEDLYPLRFTPESVRAAPHPPQLGKQCNGRDLRGKSIDNLRSKGKINLSHLIQAYQNFPDKENFFNPFFDNLAGSSTLRRQITEGYSEEEIRKTWQEDLEAFRTVRKKYLIYPE